MSLVKPLNSRLISDKGSRSGKRDNCLPLTDSVSGDGSLQIAFEAIDLRISFVEVFAAYSGVNSFSPAPETGGLQH